jgi:hypothetical protein
MLSPDEVAVPTGLGTPRPLMPSVPLVGDWDWRQFAVFGVLAFLPLLVLPNVIESFGEALLAWLPLAAVGYALASVRPRGLWLVYWIYTWLSASWLLATTRYNSHQLAADGTLELPGIRLGQLHLWGGPRYRAALAVLPQTSLELLDAEARAAVLRRLEAFCLQCTYPISIYLRTRPADPARLVRTAGPAATWAAQEQAPLLVERDLLLMVAADDRATLGRRQRELQRWLASADMAGTPVPGDELRRLLRDVLGPWSGTFVEQDADTATVERVAYRSYIVQRCPRVAPLGWLSTLTAGELPADVALHAEPILSRKAALQRVQERLRWWQAAAQVSGDSDYQDAVADGERVKADLRRQGRLWEVSLYVSAPIDQAERTEAALTESLAEWRPATWCQATVRRDTLPFGDDHARQRMELDTPSLAVTAPLASGGLWMPGGVLVGVSGSAPEPVVVNPFDPSNGNWSAAVLGMQGSGKSLLVKLVARRLAGILPELEVIAVDAKAEGEYRALVEDLGSQYMPLPDGRIVLEGHHGFNLAHIPVNERGHELRRLAEAVWERTQHGGKRPRLLVLDEAWLLAKHEDGALFLEEFGRLSRSAYLSTWFLSQQAGDFLRSETAQSVVKNAGLRILLRQTDEEIGDVAKALNLSQPARQLLMRAHDGQGIWRVGPRRLLAVHVVPTPEELAMFETNPQYEVFGMRRRLAVVA